MRRTLLCCLMALAAIRPASAQTYSELIDQARELYREAHHEESAHRYEQAFRMETGSFQDWYDAGCSWALAGNAGHALTALEKAVDLGYRNVDWLISDEDLTSLHAATRWPAIVAACEVAQEAYLDTINRELHDMFQADQADRRGDAGRSDLGPRDEARRARALEMIEAGLLKARDDFIHAAFIFQHGADSTSYQRAHDLAMKAVTIDSTSMRARWIAAATKDRYLMSVGRPQIYGTQYKMNDHGQWTQAPYDTTAVSDAERIRWGVRTLAEQRAQLRRFHR